MSKKAQKDITPGHAYYAESEQHNECIDATLVIKQTFAPTHRKRLRTGEEETVDLILNEIITD